MIVWIDAQLPPGLAAWLRATFAVDAHAVRDLGLRDAADEETFQAARAANAVVMTKDADFAALVERHGPPPQIVWVTCGNPTNARPREVFGRAWLDAQALLERGEPLVEISDRRG
jgi:predicted nuclease of predicted toxin-antitoxin system